MAIKLTIGDLRCVLNMNPNKDTICVMRLADEDINTISIADGVLRSTIMTFHNIYSKDSVLRTIQESCKVLKVKKQDIIDMSEVIYKIIK